MKHARNHNKENIKKMPFRKFLTAGILLLLLTVSGGIPLNAQLLPQDHAYQRALYSWLGTIQISDVQIPNDYPSWDGSYTSNTELANLWKEVSLRGVSNPVFPHGVFKARANWFVLDDGNGAGVEGAGQVHHARYPNNAAYWYQRSLPTSNGEGNPFYRNEGLCNRALVTTAVDMIMSDYYHDQRENPWGTNVWARDDPRFLGGLMNAWTYTFRICQEVLDSSAQQAFIDGFVRMTNKLGENGANRHTPNMQTRVIPSMANLYKSVEDQAIKDLAVGVARKYMFGYEDGNFEDNQRFPQSLIYPAGYVQEGYGPETTYNGVSLYHLLEARAITGTDPEWAFMDEPLRRMADFRAYQLFDEPSGLTEGPSAYAGRTGASWARLQGGNPWRDITLAGFYEEGRAFSRTLVSKSDMVDRIQSTLGGGRMVENFSEIDSEDAPPFAIDHDHHWPSYVPYSPPEGWYDRLNALSNSDSFELPFSRDGYYFSKSFADDFWSYKNVDSGREFGFFVESESDGGTYSGYRGGALQAFWTKDGGLFILGRQNKASNSRDWNEIEEWGAHHVFGVTSGGLFSSAVEQRRDVVYNLENETPNISVSGPLNSEDQEQAVELDITHEFRAISNGLTIVHTISPTGSQQLNELWASIPVFLRDCDPQDSNGSQCDLNDTSIYYWNGNDWRSLDTSPVASTKIALGRDFGDGEKFVYIRFEEDKIVRLSSNVWQQTYQANSRLRNVLISFIDNPGQSRSLSSPVFLEYSITTSDAAGSIPPTISNQAPSVSISTPVRNESLGISEDIELEAVVSDSDGNVVKVEFLVDGNSIGTDENGNNGWRISWRPATEGAYTIEAIATDNDGASKKSDPVNVNIVSEQATSNEDTNLTPDNFAIHQNFPNPFNAETTLEFDVPYTSHVNLSVYDLSGREIDTLVDKNLSLGTHHLNWSVEDLPSGVYFIRMETEEGTYHTRATVLK